MRFSFDDEQIAFRDAVRDLLAKECTADVVRAAWPVGPDEHGADKGQGARAEPGRLQRVWTALADMGVLGIAVPDDLGGLGLGAIDWVLLAEETGYAGLPHPFVETVCVAAPLLAGAGDPRGWAAAIAAGARVPVKDPFSGLVPWGQDATEVLLLRPDLGREPGAVTWRADLVSPESPQPVGRDQIVLPGVPGSASDGLVVEVDTVDGGRRAIGLQGTFTPLATVEGPEAAAAFDRGVLGTAAQLVGLGGRMLDLTVAYATDRRQFGVPIGSQQAVKHQLADAAMRLAFAAPAVYRAAWSSATGAPTAHRDASMAKALASDAARFTARRALQCHGAIGYTVEYDLHLYLKRAEALARAWGSADWHRGQVAGALGI